MKKARIIFTVVLSAVLLFLPGVGGFFALKIKQVAPPKATVLSGIFEVWNIDSFEGGRGDRAEFFKSAGKLINKKHSQVFFIVRSVNESQAVQMLAEGQKPDYITFAYGVGTQILPYLLSFSGDYGIREDLIGSGKAEGRTYALPYMMGGYALIANLERIKKGGLTEESSLKENINTFSYSARSGKKTYTVLSTSAGKTTYHDPLTLLNLRANENVLRDLSQADAYDRFNRGFSAMLLGTQRDLCRMENKRLQNICPPLKIEYFAETDLIQYIGITSEEGRDFAAEFFSIVFSKELSQSIKNLGMFSTTTTLYSEGDFLYEMECAIKATQNVKNVFAKS